MCSEVSRVGQEAFPLWSVQHSCTGGIDLPLSYPTVQHLILFRVCAQLKSHICGLMLASGTAQQYFVVTKLLYITVVFNVSIIPVKSHSNSVPV